MQALIDTLVALAGDDRVYTEVQKASDQSWGLYRYAALDCKCCGNPDGVYMREVFIGIAGSTAHYCARCRANNPGKFDDLM